MARIGIQYRDVKNAAIKLLTQGAAPSIQKIREVLGTGSHTTIADHLKVWRDEYANKQVHHLPANIPEELIGAIEMLWQTAMEHAENQLAAIKTDLNEQQEKAKQEKVTTEEMLTELRSRLTESQQKLEEESKKNQSLQTELAVTQTQLTHQRNELSANKKQHESRLKRAYDGTSVAVEKSENLQLEIKRLQQQLLEQSKEHQTHLAKEAALQEQSEIRWLKLIDQARLETTTLRKDYEKIIRKKSEKIDSLQHNLIELRNKLTTQESTLQNKNSLVVELDKRIQKSQEEYTEAVSTIAVLRSKLENAPRKKVKKKQPTAV